MSEKHLPETTTSTAAPLAKHESELPVLQEGIVRKGAPYLAQADKIIIEGLEVFAHHGVFSAEQELGQKFVVSLTLFANLSEAGSTDDFEATIDYGEVCRTVDTLMREHPYQLIEAAAEAIAQLVLSTYAQVIAVRVRVAKPWAPVGLPLSSCAVEIERTRPAGTH